ncbi:MAG: primosomal protein N' [Betaproteobacteria bacterium]|nr:primosomal protein N' [Betaproteobacteria bacterium]
MKIVRVGFDVPLDTLFDYRCDDATDADVGKRVLAPFGRRNAIGVVLEVADQSNVAPARLKAVTRVLRAAPAFAAQDIALMRFAAEYYQHPLGAVVLSALPAALREVRRQPAKALTHYALTAHGAQISVDEMPKRALTKRRVLELFQASKELDSVAVGALVASEKQALRQLIAAGLVEQREGTLTAAAPTAEQPAPPIYGPELTADQTAAVAALTDDLDGFKPHLLLGVTGSGKTEVYLRVIDAVLARGRQALLLVPEISLTPQLHASVCARFPQVPVVSLHSGLNETERLTHWVAAQSGAARIVLGTRLAVFAPLPALGLIVVDEEHDASFKQSEGFRYSARDLAVVRARQRGVPIVLGSATPALETWHNAASGRYQLTRLPNRINNTVPRIVCVNTRNERLQDGLAPALIAAITRRIEAREQVLIFINRRGYAPVLMCHECAWLSNCHRCTAKLVLHLKDRRLHCHHCGHQAPVPLACPDCGNADLSPVGQGTQRIEAALAAQFPQARVLRIDRDSTRRRDAWRGMRDQIEAREVDILVGTQILAKGHDFPNLSLVGVLNADSLLYSTDFRAPERLYALLTQVAGRAGRANTPGDVLIQTDFPDHPLYAALRNQNFPSFVDDLLNERRAAGFPPFQYQALLRAEAAKLDAAMQWLTRAAAIAKSFNEGITIYEPVPAGMTRLAGRERAQLLVQASNRQRLQRFLAAWRARLSDKRASTARWSIDVDPLEL